MFKDRIKELREDNDLSLVQFAKKAGISKTTVILYEAGKQNPGRKTIAKICDTFDVTEEWLLDEDTAAAAMTEKAETAHSSAARKRKKKKQSKKPAVKNTKGESKMSKKSINRPMPPMPFKTFGKAGEQDDERKAKANELKDNYKELLKKYRQENMDARKTSVQNRKDKQEQAFDRFMEMQETFADFLSENPLVLPFAPMYSIFPKKMMKQFMEIERLSNEFFKKQADNYADFCEQRKNMFLEMMASAVTKNEEPDEKSEEPEEKDEAEEKD